MSLHFRYRGQSATENPQTIIRGDPRKKCSFLGLLPTSFSGLYLKPFTDKYELKEIPFCIFYKQLAKSPKRLTEQLKPGIQFELVEELYKYAFCKFGQPSWDTYAIECSCAS